MSQTEKRLITPNFLKMLAIAGIIFLGLGAIQILPAFELSMLSTRGAGIPFERITVNSLHPYHLITLLLPFPFPIFPSEAGFQGYRDFFGSNGIPLFVSLHTGALIFCIAIVSLIKNRNREQLIWFTAILVFLFLAFGKYLPNYFRIIHHLIPFGSSFIFPVKYFLPCMFFLCLLAGNFFAEQSVSEKKYMKETILLIIAFLVLIFNFLLLPVFLAKFKNSLGNPAYNQIIKSINHQCLLTVLFITGFALISIFKKLPWRKTAWQGHNHNSAGKPNWTDSKGRPPEGLRPEMADNQMGCRPDAQQKLCKKNKVSQVGNAVLLSLIIAELLFYSQRIIWTTNRSFFSTPPAFPGLLKFESKKILPPFRVEINKMETPHSMNQIRGVDGLAERRRWKFQGMIPNTGTINGLAYTYKYGPQRLLATYQLWVESGLPKLDIYRLYSTRFYITPYPVGHKKSSFLDNKQILLKDSSHGMHLYEDKAAKPMAWLTTTWQPAKPGLKISSIDDPVPIHSRHHLPDSTLKTGNGKPWKPVSKIDSYSDGYDIFVKTDSPAFLIVSENAYPGWEAKVDSKPVEIFKAYGIFKAVYIQPGQHEVQFRFKPRSLFIGMVITITSLLILCWLLYRKVI